MASGLIFIDITPGYFDITSYLFGDILLISPKDLYMVAALDIVVAVLAMLFYNKILAVCFDDEFGGANNYHDANYLTFHRIKNYKKYINRDIKFYSNN